MRVNIGCYYYSQKSSIYNDKVPVLDCMYVGWSTFKYAADVVYIRKH